MFYLDMEWTWRVLQWSLPMLVRPTRESCAMRLGLLASLLQLRDVTVRLNTTSAREKKRLLEALNPLLI